MGTTEQTAKYYFTSQYKDKESELYYYNARYYDPDLGRFVTSDTFVQSAGGNPQTFNRYSYTGNNPVNRIDPSGYFFKKLWNWFKKNTIVGGFVDALGTGDWAQFGQQVAVLIISSAANLFIPGIGSTFSSNFFANAGLHILRGAAVGAAVGGIASSIMGGSFVQGAAIGGITGGVMGAFQGVSTSEQYQNWRGGDGFRSNSSVANSSQAADVTIVQQTEDSTGTYGKFRLSVKRGSGSSGMGGSSGDSWGHAWISHKKGDGPWTSNGFWPGEGAGKGAIFGGKYSGVLSEVNGIFDSVSKMDAFRQWSLSQGQYDNLIQHINNFKQNTSQWSLSVNCTDFATGAARSIGVEVSNINTGPFQDPNKLGDWLSSGQ